MLEEIFQQNKEKKIEQAIGTQEEFLRDDLFLSNKKRTDEVMKKYCTLYDGDDDDANGNQYHIKPLNQGYQDKKTRRAENLLTTGKEWFNMKVPEVTPEVKEDLIAMNLKKYIDPTQFAKKNDRKTIPKFFQIGRINDIITDGKRNRLRKDEVRSRIAEEILDHDLAANYSLKKFNEIQNQRRKLGLKKSKINKYKMKNQKKSGLIVK